MAKRMLLLCAYKAVSPLTFECCWELAAGGGWDRIVHDNDALIPRARSIAVSRWLRESDAPVALMIDADVGFLPAHAEQLVALAGERRGVACAAYPVRDGTHLAQRLAAPGNVVFAPGAPPVPLEYGATGFMAFHRAVFEGLADDYPLCYAGEDWAFRPYFDPVTLTHADGYAEYLSEDWAFCHAAAAAGFPVLLDPGIIIEHNGEVKRTVLNSGGPAAPLVAVS